jgi:hypothetical protein
VVVDPDFEANPSVLLLVRFWRLKKIDNVANIASQISARRRLHSYKPTTETKILLRMHAIAANLLLARDASV